MNLPNWEYLNLGKHPSTRVIRGSSSHGTSNHLRWTLLSVELQLLPWISEVSSVFSVVSAPVGASLIILPFFFPRARLKWHFMRLSGAPRDRGIMVFIDYLRSSSGEEIGRNLGKSVARFRRGMNEKIDKNRLSKSAFGSEVLSGVLSIASLKLSDYIEIARWDIKARWFIVLYIEYVDSCELFI